ncbi:MAG: protein kinase [Deltaproteobacteria bacterium]|nr:protein kinase [Deltaproteobacteria bacterium]
MLKGELNGIGPWRLGEVLGAGEHAMVYRGTREGAPPGSPDMAIKVLHAALASDPTTADAFVSRARVGMDLTRLDHPAIVPVHEVVAGPRPYVVMELVDGLSLARLMPERGRARFALEAATNLMTALLDALSAAANVKRVHGRVGASDVLVKADGGVVITSFGQDGDPRTDFLATHALAQSLGSGWLPEVDAWLDRLADGQTPWKDARAARGAFPLAFTDAGQAALERLVRNRRKKEQKAAELAAAEAAGSAPAQPEAAPTERRARGKTTATKARRPPTPTEAEAAIRQARVVAVAAAALITIALVLELTGFGG